jgi:hypothetical protein
MERSLSNEELSLFSYEILGLVGRGGAGAHDLLRLARNGRMLDWAGESQYYVEPKRLARLGYLTARKEPGKTRERTVYSLTDKGPRRPSRAHEDPGGLHSAEERHAAAPAALRPRRRSPDPPGGERDRRELAALSAQLDAAVESASALPHREKYLLLVIDFLRGLVQLHLDWIETVEERLAAEPTKR